MKKLSEIKNKELIQCKTKEQATALCNKLHELGKKWYNGSSYLDNSCWNKDDDCYDINEHDQCSLNYALKFGYTIIPFEEIDLEDFVLPNFWKILVNTDVLIWAKNNINKNVCTTIFDKGHYLCVNQELYPTYDCYFIYNELEAEPYTEITTEQFKKHVLKTTNMKNFKLKTEQAKKIISIACPPWQIKLTDLWAKELLLKDEVEITLDFYNEMMNESNNSQKEVLNNIFKNHFKPKEIDLTDKSTFKNLELFEEEGSTSTALIAMRLSREFQNKAFYLNIDFNWEIKIDSNDVSCLIPTHK